MELKTLKSKIEDKSIAPQFMIFVNEDNNFLSLQYVKELSKIWKKELQPISNIEEAVTSNSIFGDIETTSPLLIYDCDKFQSSDGTLCKNNSLIIITKEIKDEQTFNLFSEYITKFPKLEEWQIRDYMYSLAEGVEQKDLDWLFTICKGDIFRLDNELSKLKIFTPTQRKILFSQFARDGVFSDLSSYTIFNITNAIQQRDIEKLRVILPEIENIDVEPVGLVTLLYNNFKKMIQVWLSSNPTPETTGLKSNQIYAIKNLPRVYNKEQLISAFEIITSIDRKLKTGELPESLIVDYLMLKVLSVGD